MSIIWYLLVFVLGNCTGLFFMALIQINRCNK